MGGESERTNIGCLVSAEYGLELPHDLQIEFAGIVRGYTGADESEITANKIRAIFDREYMIRTPTVALLLRCAAGRGVWWLGVAGFRLRRDELIRRVNYDLATSCADRLRAMGISVRILDTQCTLITGSRQVAVCVRCEAGAPAWGVGIAHDMVTASRRAVLSAVSRSQQLAHQEAYHEPECEPG